MNQTIGKTEIYQKLAGLGLDVEQGVSVCGEQKYLEELHAFLTCFDFLKLGQNVSRGQWQSALMTARRLDGEAQRLGLVCFRRWFAGLKGAIGRRDARESKQILTQVTQRRVQLREILHPAQDGAER